MCVICAERRQGKTVINKVLGRGDAERSECSPSLRVPSLPVPRRCKNRRVSIGGRRGGHDMRMEATMGGIWIAMRVAMASPQCRL